MILSMFRIGKSLLQRVNTRCDFKPNSVFNKRNRFPSLHKSGFPAPFHHRELCFTHPIIHPGTLPLTAEKLRKFYCNFARIIVQQEAFYPLTAQSGLGPTVPSVRGLRVHPLVGERQAWTPSMGLHRATPLTPTRHSLWEGPFTPVCADGIGPNLPP